MASSRIRGSDSQVGSPLNLSFKVWAKIRLRKVLPQTSPVPGAASTSSRIGSKLVIVYEIKSTVLVKSKMSTADNLRGSDCFTHPPPASQSKNVSPGSKLPEFISLNFENAYMAAASGSETIWSLFREPIPASAAHVAVRSLAFSDQTAGTVMMKSS